MIHIYCNRKIASFLQLEYDFQRDYLNCGVQREVLPSAWHVIPLDFDHETVFADDKIFAEQLDLCFRGEF